MKEFNFMLNKTKKDILALVLFFGVLVFFNFFIPVSVLPKGVFYNIAFGSGSAAAAASCSASAGAAGCGAAGAGSGSGAGASGGDAGASGGGYISCSVYYGQTCSAANVCGSSQGTIDCNGICGAIAPALPPNFGRVCLATNVCGQSNQGTIGCDGTCSEKTAPPVISGYGVACQSAPNSCGQKANGIIGCTGVCTAITPSDLNCTTCPTPGGNGTCNINENNSNCPSDCPYVDPLKSDESTWTQATDWTLTASPNPIFSNTRSVVSWFVNGATGCTIVGVGVDSGKETDRFSAGASFDYPTSKLLETTDFTLTCSNAYSDRKDSKTVRVVVRTIKVREF